jgi:hypothetical protein
LTPPAFVKTAEVDQIALKNCDQPPSIIEIPAVADPGAYSLTPVQYRGFHRPPN